MTTNGLEAEIKALIGAEEAAGPADQLQLDVFDAFPSPVGELRDATRSLAPAQRGRPEGSKSRANLDVVRLIKATKRPTLLALKEIAETPVHELARMFGCTRLEAFDRWARVAELVTAYEEGRPTQRLDLTSQGVALPIVVFHDEPVRADLREGNPPAEDVGGTVDFTKVSDADFQEVSQVMSHEDDEPLTP